MTQTSMADTAIRRMMNVWRSDEDEPPDTVQYADLRTSTNDCWAALTLAMGGVPDVDGYRQGS